MYKKYCRIVKRELYNGSSSIFNLDLIVEYVMDVKDPDTNETFKYNFNIKTGILTVLGVDIEKVLVYTR